jgi:hypothetical protein
MPPGQAMPQQAQYQRLPNGPMVNTRPPNLATNPALQGAGTSPALVRTIPAPAPGQPVPAAPPSAPSAVVDAPLQNAAPVSKPVTPDAASKKKH